MPHLAVRLLLSRPRGGVSGPDVRSLLGPMWRVLRIAAGLAGLAALGLFGLGLAQGRTNRAAAPNAAAGYSVSIQAVFDGAGDPVLVANFSPDGSLATPRWRVCPPRPARGCDAVGTRNGVLEPGPEPAGTRFVANATYRGHRYSASVRWKGRIRALSAPRLVGSRRLGGVVNPIAARWAGGWRGDSDQLGVEACRWLNGRDCRMLGGGELGCPDSSSRTHLGGWFTGWYLFAVDSRLPRDDNCAGTGYSTNADLPLWKLGQTIVRSRALGKIAGPHRPTVRIVPRAILRDGMLLVASLDCVTRCRVTLGVEDATFGVSGGQSVIGRATVGVRRGPLAPGELTVILHVDDSPAIVGRSRFR